MNSLLSMRLSVTLAGGVLFGLALGGTLPAADFPQAQITNGLIQVKLYLPDPKNGYYRATRFDWSGEIASLHYIRDTNTMDRGSTASIRRFTTFATSGRRS